jgi:hypothetical protein
MEDIKYEPVDLNVIQNSDFLTKSNIIWADPGPPKEINDFEKGMLEGTKSVEQLLQEEREVKECKEDKEKVIRKRYITKVKIIALDRLSKHPLDNPSTFSRKEKTKVMDMMQEVLNTYTEEDVNKEFINICEDKIFNEKSDYSTYPVYES